MTRENKTQMRTALNEHVQESYEELDYNIGEFAWWLFEEGLLERNDIIGLSEKMRKSHIKQLVQFYR